MNRNPYIWSVVSDIERKPAGFYPYQVPKRYKGKLANFCKGIRRNLKRKASVIVTDRDKRVILVKVKE